MTARKLALAALVLSDREAASLLRVDRSSTLKELIRTGDLWTVPWGKGHRIPLEAVQELARRGFTLDGKPSRALSRKRVSHPAGTVGDRIRALEVKP